MKAVALTIILILTFLLALSGTALASENSALILVEDIGSNGFNTSSDRTLANLMGHFDLSYDIRDVDDYSQGDLEDYRLTLYIGESWDKNLPTAFIDDVLTTDKRVIWMNYNIWKASWGSNRQQFEDRFGFQYLSTQWTDTVDHVTYNGKDLTRSLGVFLEIGILDYDKAQVLSWMTDGTTSYPHIVRSGNFFYVAENPILSAAKDGSYLAFCDVMHEMTGIAHNEDRQALVRLEDVDPTDDPQRLRDIADYLYSENVPFSMAVIPRFRDPLGVYGYGPTVDLADRPDLVSALNYAVSRGGTIIMHGFTHQYDSVANPHNGVTGLDSEFYIQQYDVNGNIVNLSPVPEDSVEWVQDRIDSGIDIFNQAGFSRPTIWETPHYLASELDYGVFGSNFDMLYQALHGRFPYILGSSIYGAGVIPETLDYISPGISDPPVLIGTADKILVVRDGFASFFYHLYLDPSYLEETVTGIKGLGYTFVSADSLATPAALDVTPPEVSGITPVGTIYDGSATIRASYQDPGSGVNPNSVTVSIDGDPLTACDVTDTEVSCDITGLPAGAHTIGVNASDLSGNGSLTEGDFEVYNCGNPLRPSLSLSLDNAYWASSSDYQSGVLSIDYKLDNNTVPDVLDVTVEGSVNSNAVTAKSPYPEPVDLLEGTSVILTIKYQIPPGIGQFKSIIFVSVVDPCGNSFEYPGPYSGP